MNGRGNLWSPLHEATRSPPLSESASCVRTSLYLITHSSHGCKELLPGDPRPIDLKSSVAILVCHGWFQHDQVHGGFRHSSERLRNQLNRKVRAQNVSLNRVADRVLHFAEGRASRFDRLFRKHSGDLQLGQDPALLAIGHPPIHVAVPYMLQPGANTLPARET